jgi:hypothetical protein
MLKIKFTNQTRFFNAQKLLAKYGYRTLSNPVDSRKGCALELKIIIGRYQNPNVVLSRITSILKNANIPFTTEN